MATILSATEIVVRHNDRVILDKASIAIEEGERIGMVGRNGSGKSTLVRVLAGLQTPDSGEVNRRRDLLIGYLPQQFALDPNRTVEENVRSGAERILQLIEEFENLPAASGRHAELEQRINALDGWHLDYRIAEVMSHLNCPPGGRLVGGLSGGEQRRVALSRALVSRPDLLLLDEPTNHLDAESIDWLADYLQNYPGAFLAVTHDRFFLDRITTAIAEVAWGQVYQYTGNYTDYLLAKAEREAAAEVTEHKRQMFLRRELEWVRRGPKARTTKSQSRLDRYFEVAGRTAPELDGDVDLVAPPPPPLGNRIVDLTNVGMVLGERHLFSGLNLKFVAGQRLGITGRNGLGKSTLLKIILGRLEPTEGSVRIGQLVRFNYVDQGRLQLDEEKTVLEQISDGSEFVHFGEHRLSVRGYLKRFLFTDEKITTQVKHLSGGERSRLILARILKQGGNFIILDEPTNDLDLSTLRVLEETLMAFPGVVVVVSHDRYFLNRVCTEILAFEGEGKVQHSVGNYDYYWEKRKRAEAEQAKAAIPQPEIKSAAKLLESANSGADKPTQRPRKLSFKEARELESMEATISGAEENIARIEALFGDPDFHRKHGTRVSELTEELAAEKKRLQELYARWEELEAIRSASS